jgi:DNA polymerase III subunit delta'
MIDILPWHRATLAELISRGRAVPNTLPHALLVHGRSGIGKVEFARTLAQSLLCEAPEDGMACGKCAACGWFSEGNHPDYRELKPEALSDDDESEEVADIDAKEKKKSKEIKIDQIRAIGDFMTLSTHRDGYRVLLIHPAEAMNLAAANALLKTLEEPPPRSVILLVSDQLGRLLATIRSRCQRVLVPVPDAQVAIDWLKTQKIANAENALAAANGGPMDAINFAESDYQSARKAFVAALAESNMDYAQAAQNFEKADLPSLLHWLQTWVNDVITERMTGQITYHRDHAKAIARIASQIDMPRVFRLETELRQTRRLINHPLNARLLLEALLISYRQAIKPTK